MQLNKQIEMRESYMNTATFNDSKCVHVCCLFVSPSVALPLSCKHDNMISHYIIRLLCSITQVFKLSLAAETLSKKAPLKYQTMGSSDIHYTARYVYSA